MAEELGVDYLEFANIQYYNWAMLMLASQHGLSLFR